jgi:hypothetical protein
MLDWDETPPIPCPALTEHRFWPANQAQRDFLLANEKIVAYVGGLGSGKTHVGAFWALTMMLAHPEGQGLIAANTYKQLESATMPKVFQFLNEFKLSYRYNQQHKILTVTLNHRRVKVHCRSLSEYQDLRGTEFLWIWLDETRDTKEDAFHVILGRLRQRIAIDTEKGPAFVPNKLRITTTPDMLKCRWLYDYLHNPERQKQLEPYGISIREITASSKENPYLGEDYVQLLEGCYDAELAKQELGGEWVIIPVGKPVFGTSFVPAIHLQQLDFNPEKPLILGLDWGYHHPAAVFCQEDQKGRWLVLGELLEQDKETGEFCEAIWRYLKARFNLELEQVKLGTALRPEVYCDPAGSQKNSKSRKTDIEIAREYQLYPIYRQSGILDGIAILRRKLGQEIEEFPAMMIDPQYSPLLVEGFRGAYHYPEKLDPNRPDQLVPLKDGKYDHLFDALRYIGINKYRKPNPPKFESQPFLYDIADPLTGY